VRSKPKIGLILAIAVAGAATLFGSLAGAKDTGVKQKLASAREEAGAITARINAKEADIAELQRQADAAAARSRDLLAQLKESTARSTALNDDLLAAEKELAEARKRYKAAVGVLAERLVAIYKDQDVDYLSALLESDGFDELETRSEYLQALTDADERIADRVDELRDQVADGYQKIADLKASIDAESKRLEEARDQIEQAKREAERKAAEVEDAKASEEADLRVLQDRISGWELEVRQQAAEALGDGAYLGGPYSIPTYIVMCESGGNYRAVNPSSGAGGAYQILPSTWRAYGGHGLPQNASKAEQDRIAAIIWANDGPGAWSCA
jgi:septal ring factor EnvC (AmiA/AmiB activator)